MFTIRRVECYLNPIIRYASNQTGGKVIPPPKVTKDVFGPPDPKSNLRLIRFYIPPNETKAEQDYRLKRMKVQAWNQKFWSDHNIAFSLGKEEFIAKRKSLKGFNDLDGSQLTAEEMSEFYCSFLDQNYAKHMAYNKEWHKKNFKLLWPGIKAFFAKCKRKIISENLT